MKTPLRSPLNATVLALTAATSVLAAPFTPGNLAVVVFGDGSAPLSNAGTPISIIEFTTGGLFVQNIPIPSAAGGPMLVVSGTATSEGALARSADGQYLTFTGYGAPAGTPTIVNTPSTTVPREVGALNLAGVFTIPATTTTQFSANNIRSGVTDGLNNFWAGGGNNGTYYFGFTAAQNTIQAALANTRVHNIQNGRLMFSTASGSTRGIFTFSGTPTVPGGALAMIVTGTTSSSPYGFAISPSGLIAYVADDTATAAGGIQRWNNVAGTWTLAYTLGTGVANVGARGLAVDWSGPNPILYATTAEPTASLNRLIRITDAGPASPATLLVTVAANRAFRGVAFTPSLPPLVVTCPPSKTVTATSAAGAIVYYSGSSASGGCPPLSPVNCVPPSGSLFPVGTTSVSCTATDACGQVASCNFTVTVKPPMDPCLEPDNGSGTVTLPPAGCQYLSPDEVHMIIDGLPAGTTIQLAPIHKDFICRQPGGTAVCTFNSPDCKEPGGMLNGEKECAESTLELRLRGTGNLAGFDRLIRLPIGFETHVGPRTVGDPVQSFDTEMFRLFGQLPPGDPDFDLLRITAGHDFGLPSPGHTTLTRQGPPGSGFAVDSFFDITYRIDFVGHQGGALGGLSGSTTATIRMIATRPPPVEVDYFPMTTAEITIQKPDNSQETVSLSGPTLVHVKVATDGTGPEVRDSDGDGLEQVPTEMVSMNLNGNSSMGPVMVTLAPGTLTGGEIEETSNMTNGRLDVDPFTAGGTATSTFRVYPQIAVGGQTLRPATPILMQALIRHKPPGPGDTYTNVFLTPVDLLDANGNPTGMKIVREVHTPRPVEVDIMPATSAEVTLQKPDGTFETVVLSGPTEVHVLIGPDGTGPDVADSDADGLEQVPTEMVSMNLTGTSSMGPVAVTLSPSTPSTGEIEETVNLNPAKLDVDPFTAGATARSTFTVFPLIQVGGQTLHPTTPIQMGAILRHKPPGPGDTYTNIFLIPVDLLDASGNPTGIKIVREVHTPRPVEVDIMPATSAEVTLQKPDGTLETVALTGPTEVHVQIGPTGTGPDVADGDGDGLEQVPTEMVSMNLTGNSSMGPVQVTLDPSQPTIGDIEETANSNPGKLDVDPFTAGGTAISRFAVRPIIIVGTQPLHPATPINMQALIRHKPPGPGDTYTNIFLTPVDLLDANGIPTGIKIVREVHTPRPVEVDYFPNTTAQITIEKPDATTEVVNLTGPTEVHVMVSPTGTGPDVADTDSDGLEEVPTEMVMMNLTGTSSMGLVSVTLNPAVETIGDIEETANLNPSRLDVDPFTANATAISRFAVYARIQVGASVLFNQDPIPMQALIHHKPPRPGDQYVNPFTTPIILYDANGNPTGFKLRAEVHTPNPPPPLGVSCAADITITASGAAGAIVYYPTATTTGGCAPVNVVCNPPSGSTFPVGTTTVTCTATDACGQIATCTFDITVRPPTGDPCLEPDNGSGTVTLPPAGCEYLSPDEVHMIIDGLPAGTTIQVAAIHKNFLCQTGQTSVCSFNSPDCREPGGTLNGEKECANSTLELTLTGTGSLDGFHRVISLPVGFETHVGPRTPGQPVQSFDTDMFRLFGQIVNPGSGDPDFDLLRIVGGTDFGMPSPGHTTLTRQGPPGSGWAVDSFFDITYRIDFVGKAGGALSGMSGSTTATIRMVAVRPPLLPIALTCSPDITLTASSAAGAMVSFISSASGGCSPVTVNCVPPSGSTFPVGTNTVTCTATDACGQTTNCTFTITVNPPVGNPCLEPDNGSGTVTLPPAGCQYLSPDEVHMIIDGLPPGTTIQLAAIHKDFICSTNNPVGVCTFSSPDCHQPGGTLGGEKECASSTLELTLTGTGTLAGFNRVINLPVGFETHVGPRTPGDPVQSFDTDMFRLFGQITGDPDFDLLRITGGTDFGMPSPGHTTLTRQGPPGSGWAVDSFFDIEYRIDFVGAPGGPLAGRSGSTTATIRMIAVRPPPPPIVLNCSSNITVTASSAAGAMVSFISSASGGCSPVTVNCVPPSGSTFPVGTNTVTCTATDACGQTTNCTFTITVNPPVGNPCLEPDNGSGTVTLPPAGCEYLSPDEVHMIIDGLPPGTTIQLAAIHKDFICNKQGGGSGVCSFNPTNDCREPGGTLGGEKECADSTLRLTLDGTGTLAGFHRVLHVPVSFETHIGPRTPGDPIQSFDTAMFRLFGQLPPGDPDFDLLRIVAGNDFGLPSPGHTTLTRQGPPGSNWAVDSFFDIEYRIDFVGAPGGPLAGRSGSTTATIRMVAVQAPVIPPLVPRCSSNITVTATSAAGAVVNYSSSGSGGCSPVVVNCVPPTGSTFPIGTTTVTCTVTDACDQTTNCTFTVTVVRPTITTQFINGILVISWNAGILQIADHVNGPYVDMDPQPTSPHPVSPNEARKFFRVRSGGPGFTFYDTEMLELNIEGGGLPPLMRIRESPTLPSLGKTAIAPLPGGGYVIDSFFDVFTELSTDGGQSWHSSTGSPPRMRFTGSAQSDNLPPREADYVSPAQWHALYAQGVYLTNAVHRNFTAGYPPPPAGGSNEVHTFGSTVNLMVKQCPTCPPQPVSAAAQVTVSITSRP